MTRLEVHPPPAVGIARDGDWFIPDRLPDEDTVTLPDDPSSEWLIAHLARHPAHQAATDLPENIALYEATDTNPSDPESLLLFAKACGGFVVPEGRWVDLIGNWTNNPTRAYLHLVSWASEELRLPHPPNQLPEDRWHIAEVAVRVLLLQSLARLATVGVDWKPVGAPGRGTDLIRDSFQVAVDAAGVALTRYAPRLALYVGGSAPTELPGPDDEPSSSVFTAAVVQLFNETTDGRPPKRCARTGCRRWFFTQRGRAAHRPDQTHRRADSIYCSAQCARRAAQSAYRARQKETTDG